MSALEASSGPKIVVATDFSLSAWRAVQVARDEAQRRGAELFVLHVVRSPEEVPAGLDAVAELATSLGHEVRVAPVLRVGSPALEIVRYADEHDADLIVVGGHGRTGITQTLLGSVAERVARMAMRPVLVIPLERHEGVPPTGLTLQPCIVCGGASEDLVCEPCRANIRSRSAAAQWASGEAGFMGDLDQLQCAQVLHAEIVGRFCCQAQGRLYAVPMAYAYEDGAVYFRSVEGTKVRIMRENPEVCLQVDHIKDMANWRSVIAWGTFSELQGAEATDGLRKLMGRLLGWTGEVNGRPAPHFSEGDGFTGHRGVGLGREAVVGRIQVSEMTGRYQQS